MAQLIYTGITSLDGYVVDADGSWDWSAPDEEVHTVVNDVVRSAGTHLYGRRMYEVLRYWETADTVPDQPPVVLEFAAIWQAADKIVYSRSLQRASTARTRIEHEFDPGDIRALKAVASGDITIGGAELAAQAIKAGLVDEYHQFISPIVVGGGKRFLPDSVRLELELLGEQGFGNGVVHLHYRART
jgi:dihydrofolate reductase